MIDALLWIGGGLVAAIVLYKFVDWLDGILEVLGVMRDDK